MASPHPRCLIFPPTVLYTAQNAEKLVLSLTISSTHLRYTVSAIIIVALARSAGGTES